MKKTMLFLVIVCSSFVKLPAQGCITYGPHRIDFDKALPLFKSYISAKNQASIHYYTKGGYVEIPKAFFTDILDQKDTHCGFLVWFLEKDGKFYSACDQVIMPDEGEPRDQVNPKRENYVNFSNKTFTSAIENTRDQLSEFNRLPVNNYRITDPSPIKGSEILTQNASYLSEFSGMTKPAGFFHTENIADLLRQSHCIGMRIYWGYETGDDAPVRMIAFGIDDKGKNIFSGGVDGKDLILEQSWPPSFSKKPKE